GAVAGGEVDVALRVDGGGAAGLPDAAQAAGRGGVVDGALVQPLGVEADHPAVVRAVIAVRGERHVDHAAGQDQARSLQGPQGVEDDEAADAAVAGARDESGADVRVDAADEGGVADGDPAALLATGDVQGVQPLDVVGDAATDLLGLGDDVQGVGVGVDDGRAG